MSQSELQKAKLAVNADVGYCLKTTSKGLNYSYASEAELIAALRPAMTEHGLTIDPVDMELVSRTEYQTARKHTMFTSIIKCTYRLQHVSGTHEDIVVFGEGADIGDKGLPKAMTCALKYALRQSFLIETGDDPDKFISQEKAQPSKAKVESEESFGRVVAAIRNAGSIADLKRYQHVYQKERNFSAEQIALLDQHVADRTTEIDN
jgi:hypothetical protein